MDCIELVKALIVGLVVGIVFAVMKLPTPAPPAFAGIVGILGMFLGYLLIINLK